MTKTFEMPIAVDIGDIADAVRGALLRSNARLFSAKYTQSVPVGAVRTKDLVFNKAVKEGAEICHLFKNVQLAPQLGEIVPHNPQLENMLLLNNTCEDAALNVYKFIVSEMEKGSSIVFGDLFTVSRIEMVVAQVLPHFFEKSVSVITGEAGMLSAAHPPNGSDKAAHRWCRVFDAGGRCVNIDPSIEQYPAYIGPPSVEIEMIDGGSIVQLDVSKAARKRRWLWLGTDGGKSGVPLFNIQPCDASHIGVLQKTCEDVMDTEATRVINKEIWDACACVAEKQHCKVYTSE